MTDRKAKPPVDARDAGVPFVDLPRREVAAPPARGEFREMLDADEDA